MEEVTLNKHHEMVMDKLHDIDEDTECILKEIGGKEMSGDFDSGALMGMLANKGVDPGVIAMLENCRKDGSWGDGGMLIVLFLILILGFGNGGGFFGNRNNCAEAAGIDRTIFNQSNFENLADAIRTQGTRQEMAVNQLANNFNCTAGQVQMALAGLDKQLAMTNGNVVNAIQNVGCQLGQQLSECCCRTSANLDKGFCNVNSNIQDVRYLISSSQAAQDNLIQAQFAAQNAYLAQQFGDIRMREDSREIQSLRDQVQALREDRNTALILNAISNKDTIAYTGTITGSTVAGSGTLS